MTDDELLQLIEQAAKKRWATLDLSRQGLTVLPPEIGQLSNLTQIDLSANELTMLPPEIGKLSSLTTLDLNFNKLGS